MGAGTTFWTRVAFIPHDRTSKLSCETTFHVSAPLRDLRRTSSRSKKKLIQHEEPRRTEKRRQAKDVLLITAEDSRVHFKVPRDIRISRCFSRKSLRELAQFVLPFCNQRF